MERSSVAPHTILVHGLARSRHDMFLLAPRLRRALPETRLHIFDYRSRRLTLEQIVEQLALFVGQRAGGEPVSFVGHSLGGIVVRALDARGDAPAPLHRLVTLGSPHAGASIAALLNRARPFRAIFGPVLAQLADLQLPEQPKQISIGCVVGSGGSRLGFMPLFGEDNDGIVTVSEATLGSAEAHAKRFMLHALFPFSSEAARLSALFLRKGNFLDS